MDTFMFSQQTRSCFQSISPLATWHLNVSVVIMVSNGILICDQTPSTINSFVWYNMYSCHKIRELKFDLCHKYNKLHSYYDITCIELREMNTPHFWKKRTVKSGWLVFLHLPIRTDIRWGISRTWTIRTDDGWGFGGWCGPAGWCSSHPVRLEIKGLFFKDQVSDKYGLYMVK